jgi:hypothetical protein
MTTLLQIAEVRLIHLQTVSESCLCQSEPPPFFTEPLGENQLQVRGHRTHAPEYIRFFPNSQDGRRLITHIAASGASRYPDRRPRRFKLRGCKVQEVHRGPYDR